jgi:type VI secretion system secreted protein Hcp
MKENDSMRQSNLLMSIVLCVLCCIFSGVSFAAETVHLTLTGVTQGWIQGESIQTSLGRQNTIEAVGYTHMLVTEPNPDTGIAGKVRDHFPVTILKRIDKSSPRLFKAWCTHEELEGIFKFYRPNPNGDGTTEQFYIVVLRGAFISGIRQEVLNCLEPATSNLPPVERISFTYGDIRETWVSDSFTYGDEWHTNITKVPLSDVNFDGIVNMKDFAIMADDWLTQY